jgi:hypothetical protein
LDGTVGSSNAGYTPVWRIAFSVEWRLLDGQHKRFDIIKNDEYTAVKNIPCRSDGSLSAL